MNLFKIKKNILKNYIQMKLKTKKKKKKKIEFLLCYI